VRGKERKGKERKGNTHVLSGSVGCDWRTALKEGSEHHWKEAGVTER